MESDVVMPACLSCSGPRSLTQMFSLLPSPCLLSKQAPVPSSPQLLDRHALFFLLSSTLVGHRCDSGSLSLSHSSLPLSLFPSLSLSLSLSLSPSLSLSNTILL